MRLGFTVISTAAARRARGAPNALLWLWAAHIAFAATSLLAFRAALGASWAHRPAPGLLEIGSLALRQSAALLPPAIAAGLIIVFYSLASPLLHAVALRKLSHERQGMPSTGRVVLAVLRLALLFTLARAVVGAAWLLTWPQLDRISQHLADERWQILLLGAFAATGLLLWSWLSLLLRHTTAALALGLAEDARSASRLVARAHHDAAGAMWSCWSLERAAWAATLLAGFALHLPTSPLTWGVALSLEALVVVRIAARLWALAAAAEVLFGHLRGLPPPGETRDSDLIELSAKNA